MPESARWPQHGWSAWNRTAIHIKVQIDDSVTMKQAVGEAITRWNDAVGCRFLMTPDKGENTIVIVERKSSEWPFSAYPLADGRIAAGFALNYNEAGHMLGIQPGKIYRSELYLNREALQQTDYWVQVSYFSHEIGHSFGLADHPEGHLNSIMGYAANARRILGPTLEDELGIAGIYGLESLDVTPEMLDGIAAVEHIWWQRRDDPESRSRESEERWQVWIPEGGYASNLIRLAPLETYYVKAHTSGSLGFGRFQTPIWPNVDNPWMFI